MDKKPFRLSVHKGRDTDVRLRKSGLPRRTLTGGSQTGLCRVWLDLPRLTAPLELPFEARATKINNSKQKLPSVSWVSRQNPQISVGTFNREGSWHSPRSTLPLTSLLPRVGRQGLQKTAKGRGVSPEP